jgi:hypothetical protein
VASAAMRWIAWLPPRRSATILAAHATDLYQ